MKRLTKNEFVARARKVHGDRYSYQKVEYKDIHTKVCITCPIHGDFWQEPNLHLNFKRGCPLCGHIQGGKTLSNAKAFTQEQFIKKSNIVHDNKYDYSQAHYTRSRNKVYIICPEHGGFWQVAGEHMEGAGCPSCNRRIGEEHVARYLKERNIKFIEQYRIQNDNLMSGNKFFVVDFYLPDKNIIIEYNGGQHYKPVGWFGGVTTYNKQQDRDFALRFYCKEHNIKLIEIPPLKRKNIKDSIKTYLKI